MFVNDRGPFKCGQSSSKDGSDLSLSGSQVSLVSRPRSVTGKASIRALSVSGPRPRRPMSAMPTLSYTDVAKKKRRPYSADGQPLVALSHQHLNKASACFSLTSDFVDHPNLDLDVDGDLEFSSSTVLSSQMSDNLGNAWVELDPRSPYLNCGEHFYHSYSTDNSSDLFCYSDISEEPTRSEKSLGEHIRAMAQFHLQNISIPSAHSTSQTKSPSSSIKDTSLHKEECPSEKNQAEEKLEDTKNMTTRELHLRMVESGLFCHSQQTNPQIFEQSSEVRVCHEDGISTPDSHAFLSKNGDKGKALLEDRTNFEAKNCLGNQNTASRIPDCEADKDKSWLGPSELITFLDKAAYSLDEVSFPDEHDVDSLDGDSRNSNHGHLSNRGIHEVSGNNGQTTENVWMKESVVPVRFQQWVSTNYSKNRNSAHEDSFAFYFCGAQSKKADLKQATPLSDCTIEEVSGDVEFGDDSHDVVNTFRTESNDVQTITFENATKSQCKDSNNVPSTVTQDEAEITGRVHMDSSSNVEVMPHQPPSRDNECLDFMSHEKSFEALDATRNSEEYMIIDQKKKKQLTKCGSNLKEKSSKYIIPGNKKKEDSVKCIESSNWTNHENSYTLVSDSSRRKGGVTSIQGKKKSSERKSDGNFNSEKNAHTYFKRKNDIRLLPTNLKSNVTARKGRSIFSHPTEETLPGESQPELASWMSMCSDNLENGNSSLFNSSQKKDVVSSPPAIDSEKEDSPYCEILTILRVLEENEDASSLDRILAKRDNAMKHLSPSNKEEIPGSPVTKSTSADKIAENKNLTEANDSVTSLKSVLDDVKSEGSPQQCLGTVSDSCQNDSLTLREPSCSWDALSLQSSAQGELRDLLTFLDAVDQSCSSVLQSNPRSPCAGTEPAESSGSHGLEELLLKGQSDLAQEIVSLRLSVEERDATIKLLRSALSEQKENQERKDALHCEELKDRTRQVKVEFEAVVKRHQKFIDQLIADKKSLSERCESLIQENRQVEEKYSKSLSNLEEKHKIELQRMKDITAATEKLKRERWVETKTKKIKELTVRGLEPELTRLTAQHEQEMSALRTLHAQEIEQIELRAARRAAQQMETLREQLIQEKEDALTREREVLRQRIEKQQLLYEEEGAEQRRRLVAEVRREKDRIATLEARMETQFEERKRALERELEQERERLRREYADKIDEIQRKQQLEVSQLRDTLKAEKDTWLENYQHQQKQSLSQATAEIREQLKRERDREIEIVIERLENEASLTREEKEKAAENRLRRVREQLTSELREVECSLNSLKEKYVEMRAQAQEKEDKLVSIEILNRSLQTQLMETQKVADQLSAERADLKQVLRGEIESEMKALHQQLAEQHSRHQQDLKVFSEQTERERSNHQQELQQLHNRIKLAIAKKEEVIKAARAKQKLAEEQCAHFQALLEQKRRESILS